MSLITKQASEYCRCDMKQKKAGNNTGWETATGIWYQLETVKVRYIIEKNDKQNVTNVEKMTY